MEDGETVKRARTQKLSQFFVRANSEFEKQVDLPIFLVIINELFSFHVSLQAKIPLAARFSFFRSRNLDTTTIL